MEYLGLTSLFTSVTSENKIKNELHSMLKSYEVPKSDHLNGDDKKKMKTLKVEDIKPLILNEVNSNPDLYNEKDILRIKTDDHFIQRYINEYASDPYLDGDKRFDDKKMSIKDKVIRTLKWRQEFEVNEFHAKMFPKEFYESKIVGFSEIKNSDAGQDEDEDQKDDNNNQTPDIVKIMLYTLSRRYRKFEGLQEHFIKFGCYLFDQQVKSFGDKMVISGFTDATNVSISNMFDIKMGKLSLPILLRHFPGYGDHVYMYHETYGSIPWFAKPIYKLILKFVPEKYRHRFTIINQESINQLMPKHLIPNFMGGPVDVNYVPCEEGCITFKELHQQLGLSDDVYKKNVKLFNQLQNEIADEEKKIEGIKKLKI